MKIDEHSSSTTWFCVDFMGNDGDELHMWVNSNGSMAEMVSECNDTKSEDTVGTSSTNKSYYYNPIVLLHVAFSVGLCRRQMRWSPFWVTVSDL